MKSSYGQANRVEDVSQSALKGIELLKKYNNYVKIPAILKLLLGHFLF
ncbi:MAG: hypothetical protein ABIN89_23635 [Chitinophagaceae bacterium]